MLAMSACLILCYQRAVKQIVGLDRKLLKQRTWYLVRCAIHISNVLLQTNCYVSWVNPQQVCENQGAANIFHGLLGDIVLFFAYFSSLKPLT